MDGWMEWLLYTLAMVGVGVGLLIFFTNPLLTLGVVAVVALATFVARGGRDRRFHPDNPFRPEDK